MSNQLSYVGEQSLDNAVERLKSKGAAFSDAYQKHLALYVKVKDNPKLLSDWIRIKKYADGVKMTIQTINNSVDKSVNWLKDVFGFQSDNLQGLQGVGVLPLIPIAYVLAALAALTYVISEMIKFSVLVNKGATVEQLTKTTSGLTNLTDIIKWGGIAFGLYMLYQKFGHHLKD